MRILWLTETPSKYKTDKNSYNGRGWIESLQTLIEDVEIIDQLGIAFPHSTDTEKATVNNTIYYPIKKIKSSNFISWIISNWKNIVDHEEEIAQLEEIIADFKPDAIHIFGTESWLCHAIEMTNIPCIVHLQGLLLPTLNTYLPIEITKTDLISNQWIDFLKGSSMWHYKRAFAKKAKREYKFFKKISFFMGRTNWDKSISELLSPKSRYFHVDEILRNSFYDAKPWNNYNTKKIIITSTLSNTIYKGLDLVIKTASILIKEGFEFEWRIIGVTKDASTAKLFKKKFDCEYNLLNIKLLGIKNAAEIVELMGETTMYVHTSYIDNSPNSLCEAQLMGVPVIATNVGGVSSLIEESKDGYLVPANDPYLLASTIKRLSLNELLLNEVSKQGRLTAQKRHSKENILNQLLSTYNHLIKKESVKTIKV